MKPYKRLYYISRYVFLLEVFGLNRRCETFNSTLIILILFTNKNLACVQTSPPFKNGEGVSAVHSQAIKTSHSFSVKKRKKIATNIKCSTFVKILSFDAVCRLS